MFIGLGKMLGKFKIRIGVGLRVTKNNIYWMLFIVMVVSMFRLMWYLLLLCFWAIYVMFYGFYVLIKWIVRKIKGNK